MFFLSLELFVTVLSGMQIFERSFCLSLWLSNYWNNGSKTWDRSLGHMLKEKEMTGDLVSTRGRVCHPEILHISDNLSCHLLGEIRAKTMTVVKPRGRRYACLLLLLKAKSHVKAPKMCFFSPFSHYGHIEWVSFSYLLLVCLIVTKFSLFWMPGPRIWPYKFWLRFQSSVVPSSKH